MRPKFSRAHKFRMLTVYVRGWVIQVGLDFNFPLGMRTSSGVRFSGHCRSWLEHDGLFCEHHQAWFGPVGIGWGKMEVAA